MGACSSFFPQVSLSEFPWAHELHSIVPLTPLSQPLLDTGRVFSRNAGTDSAEAAKTAKGPVAVKRPDFPQPEMPSFDEGCAALAPLFRAAIAHPILGNEQLALSEGFPQAGAVGGAHQGSR